MATRKLATPPEHRSFSPSRHETPSTLRILVLTPECGVNSWGGLATYVNNVVSGFRARGHIADVLLDMTYVMPRARFSDPRVTEEHEFSRLRGESDSDFTKRLISIIKSPYDVAFVQDHAIGVIARSLYFAGKVRQLVSFVHLPSYGGFSYFDEPCDVVKQRTEEAALYRMSSAVLAPSDFAADILTRVHRLRRSDIVVFPLGVYEQEAAYTGRYQYRQPSQTPLDVVVVGRIAKQKGLFELADLVRLVPSHIASFTHIGSTVDASVTNGLDGLPINLLGQLPHATVLQRLASADVLLSTSFHETFGLAVLEGMASGAVPVAFAVGSLNELVSDGYDGFLVDGFDLETMACRLAHLWANPTLLETMSDAARAASRTFTWSFHVDSLIEIFKKNA